MIKIKEAKAHCDIPCAIYDPYTAQFAALSIVRILDLIEEIDENSSSKADLAKLVRLISQKEEHAAEVKEAIRVIWGDYFKQPQIEKFPEIHDLTHTIMMTASKCKQELNRNNGISLLEKVNRFAEIFWATKDVDTKLTQSLNPPNLDIISPS
tara:strand:- start:3010 stop:3468 length:459 start_codon:yes stop_codon:yes gene_type:complete